MFSYRAARAEHLLKLIENDQNIPRLLFSTVAGLTHIHMLSELNIAAELSNNNFINFFSDKIETIRNTVVECTTNNSTTGLSFKYHPTLTTAVLYHYKSGSA